MKIIETKIPGVVIIEPRVFRDNRGFFLEAWQQKRYTKAGLFMNFVQDNISFSTVGVLRGLHFQNPNPQAKLVTVLQGEVFEVAVDIRLGSPTFCQWVGVVLSSDNVRQMFIPAGFAHGFCVTSPNVLYTYKCSSFYAPEFETSILWNDPDIGIAWPIDSPILSEKDGYAHRLKAIDPDRLPRFKLSA